MLALCSTTFRYVNPHSDHSQSHMQAPINIEIGACSLPLGPVSRHKCFVSKKIILFNSWGRVNTPHTHGYLVDLRPFFHNHTILLYQLSIIINIHSLRELFLCIPTSNLISSSLFFSLLFGQCISILPVAENF